MGYNNPALVWLREKGPDGKEYRVEVYEIRRGYFETCIYSSQGVRLYACADSFANEMQAAEFHWESFIDNIEAYKS